MSFPNSQGGLYDNGQFNNVAGDAMSFFSNSHGATYNNGQFNHFVENQHNQNTYSTVNVLNPTQTALQTLWQAIADVGAAHNSEARYPQPRCHPETREKVRRLFIDWVRLWKRTWWVYWLYGPAGAGKSAVAQSISEECHKSGDLVSSFFHSRNHPKRNNPAHLSLTVAYGLACIIPELQEPIGRTIHRNPAILHTSIEEQFTELIAKPCRWLTQREEWGSRPRLVIIDGLDECEGGHAQRRILRTIASSVREPEGLPLQFLICSRPEPAIREFFDTKPFYPLHWYYPLDDDDSTYRDILVVLQDGFAKIRADVKFCSIRFPAVWPSSDDVHRIARKACGQFVYVSILLSWIAEGSISPCTALEIVLGLVPNVDGDSPFEDLDVLYRHILSTHPKPQLKKVMKILAVILHPNPSIHWTLSLEDIETLVSLPEGEVVLVLRGLHSVLKITDTVAVRHASFTDFLNDPSRSGVFFLDTSLPVKHQDLISRFRSASAGFHLFVPVEDTASVLDAVLGLLAVSQINPDNEDSTGLTEQSLDYLKKYGFSRFKAQVKAINPGQCPNRRQCAAHDLPMSERSLKPVECSPGVVFVRPQHIIPHLITVIGHRGVIEALCYPYFNGVKGMSLLHLVRQPSPSLLPLLEPAVANILIGGESSFKEAMLLALTRWLKSLLPDPAYHLKTVSFMQQVRDWTIHTSSPDRPFHNPLWYKETCQILDEAGIGNGDGSRDKLGLEHVRLVGSR
ncbi:hypothetical protein V5O48_008611 [Marasmius crinis-equi]|uniref:Nephrocystin 3-like N-terminal domain-containing protein n=1 Tax=Marasmius crinis-equi TaxID=585013 RepID=A0ABR3FDM5_9AGAR